MNEPRAQDSHYSAAFIRMYMYISLHITGDKPFPLILYLGACLMREVGNGELKTERGKQKMQDGESMKPLPCKSPVLQRCKQGRRFFWGVLHCCIAWFILHVFSPSTEQYALCQLWLLNLAKINYLSIASKHLSVMFLLISHSLMLITTLYVRCRHHFVYLLPDRLIVLATYVPIIFGKDPPTLVISSTKMIKWVRGDVASRIARTCCRSPIAFLAQSNEEKDGWWGVRGKSEYDEGIPKQLNSLSVILIAGRRRS